LHDVFIAVEDIELGKIVTGQGSVAPKGFEVGRTVRTDGRRRYLLRLAGSIGLTLLVSTILVFSVELIVRGSLAETLLFFQQPFRPGWTTVLLFALLILFFDALLGRAYLALLVVAPAVLLLAFVGHQKSHYLGDPLYPTDFLYARQIIELAPLLVRWWGRSAFLALALVHHLAIGNNVPLPMVSDLFARLGRQLIVEFVPKSDPRVAAMPTLEDRAVVAGGDELYHFGIAAAAALLGADLGQVAVRVATPSA
jgi:hypothetical protein